MTEMKTTPPAVAPVFETDAVEADRARDQGLGLGARELRAQRDPGDVQSRDDGDVRVEAVDADEDAGKADPAI